MIKNLAIIIILIVLISLSGCSDDTIHVDLSEKETDKADNSDSGAIKIAIAAVISPEESFVYYDDMLDYISDQTNKPVIIVQRKTYQEINDLVRKKEVDIAFVCSKAYVEGHRDFGMELLVAPVVHGKHTYQSYIIVQNDSDIQQFEDLEGKTFAFTDPLSNSGRLYPTYLLANMNKTPETFFKVTFFTYSHDKSIQAVNEKLVDGAAVDSLVWEYKARRDPEFIKNTRMINRSPIFGIPPVVVSNESDPHFNEELRTIFLTMHTDKEGRAILDNLMIDRFIEVDDDLYDSIRTMEQTVEN